jgi:hypothetical protein
MVCELQRHICLFVKNHFKETWRVYASLVSVYAMGRVVYACFTNIDYSKSPFFRYRQNLVRGRQVFVRDR